MTTVNFILTVLGYIIGTGLIVWILDKIFDSIPNKIRIPILVIIVILCAVGLALSGCTSKQISSNKISSVENDTDNGYTVHGNIVLDEVAHINSVLSAGDYVNRLYDKEYNIVCYILYNNMLYCIDLELRNGND